MLPSYGASRSSACASVDLPAPLGPIDRDALPRLEVEVDAVEDPRAVGAVAHAQAADLEAVRTVRDGPRAGRVEHVGGRRAPRCTRAAERRVVERLAGGGQAGDELGGGQRDEREQGEQHGVEPPRVDRERAGEQAAPHRQAGQQHDRAAAAGGGPGGRPADAGQLLVARHRPGELAARPRRWRSARARRGAGRRRHRQLPAAARLAGLAALARLAVASGTAGRREDQRRQQDRAGGGQDQPRDSTTVTAPPSTATANGGTARSSRSWIASTSCTSRASRSPARNASSPAGASAPAARTPARAARPAPAAPRRGPTSRSP